MEDRGGIVVVGSLNLDRVTFAADLPRPGQTVKGSKFETFLGGKGSNEAVAASRLGGRVAMWGALGKDDAGTLIAKGLESEGVDTTFVSLVDGLDTGSASILVSEATGENVVVVISGANHAASAWDLEHIDGILESEPLRNARVICLQNEIPAFVNEKVASSLGFGDKFIMWNPSPVPRPFHFPQGVNVIIVNEEEAQEIAANSGGTEALPSGHPLEAVCETIFKRFGCMVVVTLGKHGARFFDGRRNDASRIIVPPYPLTAPVLDTTGAGDCFAGALAVRLSLLHPATISGSDAWQALEFANKAAALSVSVFHCSASF